MIYLDNAASSKPTRLALDSYAKLAELSFANASSPHKAGREANRYLEEARKRILKALRLEKTHSILFTSGATEGNNLALKGVAFQYASRGKKIVSCLAEHSSVKNALKELQDQFGFEVVYLPVNSEGKVDPEELKKAMDNQTILVSLMAVNNEIGSINDVKTLASIVHQYPKAYFHVDATQAIGKEDFEYSCADLLTFSGHKFGGLKGNGALCYKKTIKFLPLASGGDQEYGYRSGTVDMPGAYAMSLALEEALKELPAHKAKAKELMSALEKGLKENPLIAINSPKDHTPFLVNFSLLQHKASVVLEALSEKEIYVSSHSACDEKKLAPSETLLCMGYDEGRADNAIRVSFSPNNTVEEVETFLQTLSQILTEVKTR